ncbi:GNAT family N-acetyltransferase [Leptolyngbya sp. FACHB-261]|uniref:GNAT family N-acetyltransferase n=1 Tax=Leptolyngbya sp. FACHB-261 TaxID=2692806 RepID=UPI0016858D6A|nr:GNAT family N-acetyltransferase [Leptolyngbya sp. FACHB-261]MBD2100564.1 GNAT family N-acetyltransferase [Leptolyngbya sp. FACHB-261]
MISSSVRSSLQVRPCTAADAVAATQLLFAAGPELFTYTFASSAEKTLEILTKAFAKPDHAFSYSHAQVAEVEGEVVGLLVSYSGALKTEAENRVHQVMPGIVPVWKVPGMLLNLTDLNRVKQPVPVQDYYVLCVAVKPELQGQGIGTCLLSQAETMAALEGCGAVALDLTLNNQQALRFCQGLGYRVVQSSTTPRFERQTGAGGLQRLVKPLVV